MRSMRAPTPAPPPAKMGTKTKLTIAEHSGSLEPHEIFVPMSPAPAPAAAPINTPFHSESWRRNRISVTFASGMSWTDCPEPTILKDEPVTASKRPLITFPPLTVTVTRSPFCTLAESSDQERAGSCAQAAIPGRTPRPATRSSHTSCACDFSSPLTSTAFIDPDHRRLSSTRTLKRLCRFPKTAVSFTRFSSRVEPTSR